MWWGNDKLPPLNIILSAFIFLISCTNCHAVVHRAIEGHSVTLKCQTVPPPGLQYRWHHNGVAVSENTTEKWHLNGNHLVIENLNRKLDNGNYECNAINETGGLIRASPEAIQLEIIWLATASVQKDRAHSKPGYLTLACKVDGFGVSTIEWFKNGITLAANLTHTSISNSKLHIRKPNHHERNEYSCAAHNEAGTVHSQNSYVPNVAAADTLVNGTIVHHHKSKHTIKKYKHDQLNRTQHHHHQHNNNHDANRTYLYRLKRGDAANIVKLPLTQLNIDENGSITLNCDLGRNAKKTQGNSVKWQKDGKSFRHIDINGQATPLPELSSDNAMPREDSRVLSNTKNGSLTFSPVLSTDSGIYECLVFNDHNVQTSSRKTELKVIEQLKFAPQPTSKNLELGTVAKVHCKVQGTPTPIVKWTKENQDIPDDTIEDINGTLVFKNVSASDRGNYTCEANSIQGTISASIVISVVVAPRFVVAPSGPVQAPEMGTLMMHCQATGDPKPTIQWDKDLQYINNSPPNVNASETNRFHVLENGTLHITEVHLDDEGRYGCTIGSSAGLKREEIRLTVKPADDFANEEADDGFMITRAVLITMSVAFAYIILVVGLMLWCRYRRQARKARLNLIDKDAVENGAAGETLKMGEIEPCLPSDKVKASKRQNGHTKLEGTTAADSNNDTAASTNSKVSKKSSNFDQILMSRAVLFELVQIGGGEFGDVFTGRVKESDLKKIPIVTAGDDPNKLKPDTNGVEKGQSTSSLNEINEIKEETSDSTKINREVLIKALNKVKNESVCIEFRRQIEMFRAVSHKSVSRLYGLCRDKDPHYLVLEYTDLGDLKKYLISGSVQLKPLQLLNMAWQIARGMDAIYRARYIHKDLAARNCLVASNMDVKVSYPALNKDTYAREYYKHNNTVIPLRWLAPECLSDDDYSTKSDVFAYGMLVWEMFMAAKALPMQQLTDDEYIVQLKDHKLKWPLAEQTPTEISGILTSCWNVNPKERPSFHQLYTAIGGCMKTIKAKE